MGISGIEKPIGSYLSLLGPSGKKTVLTVVKDIKKVKDKYDHIWKDEAFTRFRGKKL